MNEGSGTKELHQCSTCKSFRKDFELKSFVSFQPMIHICKETETFVEEELGQHGANLLLFGTQIGHHLPADPAISSIKGSPGRSGRLWGVPRVAIPSQDWLPRLKKHRLGVFTFNTKSSRNFDFAQSYQSSFCLD